MGYTLDSRDSALVACLLCRSLYLIVWINKGVEFGLWENIAR